MTSHAPPPLCSKRRRIRVLANCIESTAPVLTAYLLLSLSLYVVTFVTSLIFLSHPSIHNNINNDIAMVGNRLWRIFVVPLSCPCCYEPLVPRTTGRTLFSILSPLCPRKATMALASTSPSPLFLPSTNGLRPRTFSIWSTPPCH